MRAKARQSIGVCSVVAALVGMVTACANPANPDHTPVSPTATPVPSFAVPERVPTRPPNAQPMKVRHVYDGDTLSLQAAKPGAFVDITRRVKVRLIGVDAPEMTLQRECFAQQATDYLKQLAPIGSTLYVHPDRDSSDDYNRRLFYAWTESGTLINYAIVATGHAEAIRVDPNVAHCR